MPTRSVDVAAAANSVARRALGKQGAAESDRARNVVELRRALAAAELQLAAALRQLDRARWRESERQRETEALREALVKAQSLAYHDELTGLPSRRLLRDRFKIAAALAARHERSAALLLLDLDGFKQINDTLGHLVGDKLLQQVATRLVASIRVSDTACRYGGDEFVVLLSELSGKVEAMTVANDICARLAVPYVVEGAEIVITTSLGVAVYPDDADCYHDLLGVADRAMYHNKARGLLIGDATTLRALPYGARRCSGSHFRLDDPSSGRS